MNYRRLLIIFFPLLIFLFTPNYAIQFISLIFSSIVCLSFLYSLICLSQLKATRLNTIQHTYQHDPLEIRITLRNKSLLPLHQTFIFDNCSGLKTDGREKDLIPLIRFHSRFDFEYQLSGGKRGEYIIGPLVIRGGDPIGLFPWKKQFKETEKVIIYPRVFTLCMKDDKGLPCGNLKIDNPVYEDLTNYKSIREYTPGDDLRRINWKVSARMGSLYSMQYLPSMHYSALIVLNLAAEDYPIKLRYTHIEHAIETAASLVYHCINRKQEAALVTAGEIEHEQQFINFPFRKDEGHAVQILETLAKISPGKSSQNIFEILFMPGIKIPWGCRLMYVGPQPAESRLYDMMVLKRKGINPELFIMNAGKNGVESGIPTYHYSDLG